MKRIVEIGLLQSQSGNYSAISRASRAGVLQGVDEVNADNALDVAFHVIERDPEGRVDRYAPLCREILQNSQVRHIFGCVTSASRKEVIPELERFDGVLWYPLPYEGFEASERVAYMHSCPNQHLLPLLDWALPVLGKRAYFVGSNYIWGWEMARIAREQIAYAGGTVLGDRYLAIGDTELDHIIHDIRALKPDFILNSLVGDSSYAFLQRLAGLKAEFGLSSIQAGALGSWTLAGMAIGGFFGGWACDRFGRVRIIVIYLVISSVLSCALGFADSYYQFVILRTLAAVGLGSLYIACNTLMSEYVPTKYRTTVLAALMTGFTMGSLVATLLAG